MPVLGYFISFRTYGSWLHGDDRGSVDLDHNAPGTPMLRPAPARSNFERQLIKHEIITLDEERRFVVDAAIRAVCTFRRWSLHGLNVREQHVHSVVSAEAAPERVMNDFKSWSTRRMVESGILAPDINAWVRHGSTRYLNTDESFSRATHYTLHEQGPPLPTRRPSGWRNEWSNPTPPPPVE
jgi:hypothetical protein